MSDLAIGGGFVIILPTISIVEIVYLIEKGRLVPQTLTSLMQVLKLPNSSFILQGLTEDIAQTVAQIPRSIVPEMPDRIIAATALHFNLPLITEDHKIQALKNITTIWGNNKDLLHAPDKSLLPTAHPKPPSASKEFSRPTPQWALSATLTRVTIQLSNLPKRMILKFR